MAVDGVSAKAANGFDPYTLISAPLGGAVGGLSCYPFESIKKRVERGEKLEWKHFHPEELYRGATSFATSVAIATLGQMTARRLIQSLPSYDSNKWQHAATSALAAGVVGAFVGSTPVENTILVQQVHQVGPKEAIKIMLRQGITRPWVGFPELAGREAIFALTMLFGTKKAEEVVQEKTGNEKLAFVAGLGAGVLGAVVSQPFDMLATQRQKVDGKISSLDAVRRLFIEQGAKSFFTGLRARVFLFVGCAMMIPPAEARVAQLMKDARAARV